MSGLYQPYEPDQPHLFPPSPRDWLPEGALYHDPNAYLNSMTKAKEVTEAPA